MAGFFLVFFFTFIEECCIVIEKNIDKECLQGKFGRGSKSAKGGPYPLADLDRGGPNPLLHGQFPH